MTSPGEGVDVELEALRADAEVWRGAAGELERRRPHVQGMLVAPAAFSIWGVDAGLDRTYEEVRARMEALLDQGGQTFSALADTLTAAADAYGREDAAGAHRFGPGSG